MPHNIQYGDREIAPFQLYVMARYLSALFMLLTTVLTYAAGRRKLLVPDRNRGVLQSGQLPG